MATSGGKRSVEISSMLSPDYSLPRREIVNHGGDNEETLLLPPPRTGTKDEKPLPTISLKNTGKRLGWILLGLVIMITIINIHAIFPNEPAARRCLGMFAFVCLMWATEAFPIFITSLVIPILVVWLQVLLDANHTALPAPDAAKAIAGQLFSGTVLVALGAFTMSMAFTKYQLSHRLAMVVLSRVGTKPSIVMLAVMALAIFLSMWVSNVAAPVVCIAVVKPLLDQLPSGEVYGKVLLLGIAFASNIGGLLTPIASPQMLVAINTVTATSWNETNSHGETILVHGKLTWFTVLASGIPFAIFSLVITWGVLWLYFRPQIESVNPVPEMRLHRFGAKHIFVMVVCVGTIILWALDDQLKKYSGSMGIGALIPVVLFFGFGLLDAKDFKNLSWNVIMLLSGGLALGHAISSSHLLDIIANSFAKALSGQNVWVVLLGFSIFTWFIANFISHTVCAIILLPIIASVGCELGGDNCQAGHFRLLVMGSLYMDCIAMSLPVTSFPNAQCFSVTDSDKKPYLKTSDFMILGAIVGLLLVGLNMSAGFGIYQILGL